MSLSVETNSQYNYNIKTNPQYINKTNADNSIFDGVSGNSYSNQNYVNSDVEDFKQELKDVKKQQGFIGKLWDGFKNLTGIGASSSKVEKKIEAYEKGEISDKEVSEALQKYKKGQEMAVDVAGDLVSGIVAVGAFALAVPTGGASLAAGLAIATAAGAGTKIAVKGGDALLTGKDYTGKDLLYDGATGAVNGLLAPVTNGVGASVTKTVGTKMGLTVVKQGTQEAVETAAKQGIKSVITQQAVDVVGGNIAKRAVATGAGMAVDGAISGAANNMTRAALDGEDIEGVLEAGKDGAIGGLVMSPIIGGGFKVAGKAGNMLHETINPNKALTNGAGAVIKQSSDEVSNAVEKTITNDIAEDSASQIASGVAKVSKESLDDEILDELALQNEVILENACAKAADISNNAGTQAVNGVSEADKNEAIQNLLNTLNAVKKQKTTHTQQEYALSDKVIEDATKLITNDETQRQNLSKVAKECYVSIKSPDDVKELLQCQYASLPKRGDATIVLNPSALDKQTIGSSNKYISEWCADALSLDKTSIFDRSRLSELQELINNSSGKSITIMVPDDFSGSGRSLSMNTIEVLEELNIPDDVVLDVVLAPSTATNSAKKVFKYVESGDLKRLDKAGVLEQGGSNPDINILNKFFDSKGENVHITSSDDILTVPTIYETNAYKGLSQEEQKIVETLLTTDGYYPNSQLKNGLTGYGRDGRGINCTMASFPSDNIDAKTGLFIRKSPNNNLSGAMPYSVADGVSPDKIKMPGSKMKEFQWNKQKLFIQEKLQGCVQN